LGWRFFALLEKMLQVITYDPIAQHFVLMLRLYDLAKWRNPMKSTPIKMSVDIVWWVVVGHTPAGAVRNPMVSAA